MISIIVISYNQGEILEKTLPHFLEQKDIPFEVIVVDKNSDDETVDILERMEPGYANLRHIVLPVTAHSINKDHLAVMLGIRSATWDRVIITRPYCQPEYDMWLKDVADGWTEDRSILLLKTIKGRRASIGQNIAIVMAKLGHARWAAGHALGYDRQFFMQNGGFPARTPKRMATLNILVRYYSNKTNTCVLSDAKYSLHSLVS